MAVLNSVDAAFVGGSSQSGPRVATEVAVVFTPQVTGGYYVPTFTRSGSSSKWEKDSARQAYHSTYAYDLISRMLPMGVHCSVDAIWVDSIANPQWTLQPASACMSFFDAKGLEAFLSDDTETARVPAVIRKDAGEFKTYCSNLRKLYSLKPAKGASYKVFFDAAETVECPIEVRPYGCILDGTEFDVSQWVDRPEVDAVPAKHASKSKSKVTEEVAF